MEHATFLVLLLIALEIPAVIPFSYSFRAYPRALSSMMNGADVGPFAGLLGQLSQFVRWHALSHYCSIARTAAIVWYMSSPSDLSYAAFLLVMVGTLLPLAMSGAYSVMLARLLRKEAQPINRMVKQFNAILGTTWSPYGTSEQDQAED